MYGICYEHGLEAGITFTSYKHVSDIAEVDEGEKLVVKENMVIAVSSTPKVMFKKGS